VLIALRTGGGPVIYIHTSRHTHTHTHTHTGRHLPFARAGRALIALLKRDEGLGITTHAHTKTHTLRRGEGGPVTYTHFISIYLFSSSTESSSSSVSKSSSAFRDGLADYLCV
jgi:hypothetical protein